MGIVKNILFSFFLFYSIYTNAQNIKDTVMIDGNYYVEHIVSAGESIKKIAKIHNVSSKEILDNNEIYKRIYYNQLLYIPIKKNYKNNRLEIKNQLKKDQSVLNVALLLPYYVTKNDTMFNDYDDNEDISKIYYNKSEAALSFHIGVELAIDSLRRAGKNIILHTFDTNRDSSTVADLVYSNHLNKMDIIIGPLYSRLFKILCKRYGNNDKKILISPLSRNNRSIQKYPSVYQVTPTFKVQVNVLTNYLIKHCLDKRIIVIHDNKSEELLNSIKAKFRREKKKIFTHHIVDTEVDSIRDIFRPEQSVLLLSSNKAFVSKMLSSISTIMPARGETDITKFSVDVGASSPSTGIVSAGSIM